ncbi:MAG: GTP-binding protein [Candidatus Thorarchaeota archaeon]
MALIAKDCLCGDRKVGKTSLRIRYLGRDFQSEFLPTSSGEFSSKKAQIEVGSESRELQFQIWDLAEHRTFNQERTLYFKQTVGSFIMLDITRSETLFNLERWVDELNWNSGSGNLSIFVLGNRADLTKDENKVYREKATSFINNHLENKFDNIDEKISFSEISTKTSENFNQALSKFDIKIYT